MRTQRDITINSFIELTRDNTFDAVINHFVGEQDIEQFNYFMSKGISPKQQAETFNLLFHSQTDYDLRNLLKERVKTYKN